MLYEIKNWFPEKKMNGAGFSISLGEDWPKVVEHYGLTQEYVDTALEKLKDSILEGHGYSSSRYYRLSAKVGKWGIEHISVPGNACGLDLSSNVLNRSGMGLFPHNVDTIPQASMLFCVFSFFSERMAFNYEHIALKLLKDFTNKSYQKRNAPKLRVRRNFTAKTLYIKGDEFSTYHYNYDNVVGLIKRGMLERY